MSYDKIIANWNEFIQEFPDAIDLAEFDLEKEGAIIKKLGNKWCVISESTGRNLGCYRSRPAAEKRLRQVEMFRHMKGYGEDSARRACICENCGNLFTTGRYCEDAKCPVCGKYEAHDMMDDEDRSSKEFSKYQCECRQCGRLFWSVRRCDQATCPSCGEQDDIVEITGDI